MAGNKESAKRSQNTQNERAKEREKEATDNATGKNPKTPGPPSEAWAKKRGLK